MENENQPGQSHTRIRRPSQPVTPVALNSLMGETACALFATLLRSVQADEGTLWVVNAEKNALVAAYNHGPRRAEFELKATQSLSEGVISVAFRKDEPVADTGMFQHPQHSIKVDVKLGQYTVHELAAPFRLFGELLGVASAVQLWHNNPAALGHSKDDMAFFAKGINAISTHIECDWLVRNSGVADSWQSQ